MPATIAEEPVDDNTTVQLMLQWARDVISSGLQCEPKFDVTVLVNGGYAVSLWLHWLPSVERLPLLGFATATTLWGAFEQAAEKLADGLRGLWELPL